MGSLGDLLRLEVVGKILLGQGLVAEPEESLVVGQDVPTGCH